MTKSDSSDTLPSEAGGPPMLRKIGRNYQVAVPKEVVTALRLHVNDYVEIRVKDNLIILEPQVLLPKDQAYFYTPEWQREEKEADQDIKKGCVTRTKNLKELFKKLGG